MYVAISYAGPQSALVGVTDAGQDVFTYVGGGFAGSGGIYQSVAFYEVPSEHGGTASAITVTLNTIVYGTCLAGQLTQGTTVGVVGTGGTASSPSGTAFGLSVTNAATHYPSLLLAMFGSNRPSGAWGSTSPSGDWLSGGQQAAGYNPGTESAMYGYDDTSGGTVTFTESLAGNSGGDPLILSGVAVEFYIPSHPVSGCFGNSNPCSSTTASEGSQCQIPSFYETMGDFLYVTIDYLASGNIITSVSDTITGAGIDTFTRVGGEFANSPSIAFYDVPYEHGGSVTITVSLSSPEYGTCQAGQLPAGTTVGVVGVPGNAGSATDTSLSVSNSAANEPSLLMALFCSARPSGAWDSPHSGSWLDGGQQGTGYNPGTETELFGYNDTSSGTATFTETLANSGNGVIYLSGIVVEFYLPLTYGWAGYDNDAIYPTTDGNAVGLPVIDTTSSQPSDGNWMGVSNSIAMSTYSGGTNANTESWYQYVGPINSGYFEAWISFGATGISQFMYDGPATPTTTMDIELTASLPATLPGGNPVSHGANIEFYGGANTGFNVSQTGNNPGSGATLGLVLDVGIGFATALAVPTLGLGVGTEIIVGLSVQGVQTLIQWIGDDSNQNGFNSNPGPVGPGSTINQWSGVKNGAPEVCQYNSPGYTCPNGYGYNYFGAAETVELQIPTSLLGQVQSGGSLSLGATNMLGRSGNIYPCNACSSTTTEGAWLNVPAYAIAPAVGLSGQTLYSGQIVNGAQVTIEQVLNGKTTFFSTTSALTTAGSGTWNFFANPAAAYSYWATYDGVTSPTYQVPALGTGTSYPTGSNDASLEAYIP